ncbi:MAG: alpha/beta fold hydrolase [Solirubrobacteraceae bacterium]
MSENPSASVRRTAVTLAISAAALVGLAAIGSTVSSASVTTPTLGPVKHVRADGLSFGYRTGGSGTPLLIVMGRSGTMAEWDPQLIDQLIRDHRVVIFDNRGMGTTSAGFSPDKVTVPLMAKDTLAVASALHIQRFDIMGWSMGGEITQQVAVDAPNRVLKVVLCATSSGGPTEKLPSKTVQKIMSESNLPASVLLGLSFPPTAAGLKGEFGYGARVVAQYVHDHLPKDSFSASAAGTAGQAHARTQWTSANGGVYDDLPKLTQHVLVMWGNLDVIDPPANDRTIVRQLQHATTRVFRGAGHAFLFQDATAVGRTADAFLKGN